MHGAALPALPSRTRTARGAATARKRRSSNTPMFCIRSEWPRRSSHRRGRWEFGQSLARAFVGAGLKVVLCDTHTTGVDRLHGELGADRTIAVGGRCLRPRVLQGRSGAGGVPFRAPRHPV